MEARSGQLACQILCYGLALKMGSKVSDPLATYLPRASNWELKMNMRILTARKAKVVAQTNPFMATNIKLNWT